MAIHIKKDGWEVSADTPAELKQGIRIIMEALEEPATTPKRVGRPPKSQTGAPTQTARDKNETALAFLRAISGKTEGIPASEFCTALGLKTKRAIGTPAGVTNRALKDLGFSRDSVYVRVKKVNQEKKWYPKSKMAEAIAAIEQAVEKT